VGASKNFNRPHRELLCIFKIRAVLKLQFQNSFLQKQRVLQPSWRETAYTTVGQIINELVRKKIAVSS
jgi:hypothetical protein